jgi:16S rRNA (cytosine967-C5)-methyltransferase
VTPAARIAAAIDLLAAIEASPFKPADAIANDYFRARRFIGGGDRRAVSDRVWQVLRTRRRLGWWLREDALTRNRLPLPLREGAGGEGSERPDPTGARTPPPSPLPRGEGESVARQPDRRTPASPRLLVAASLLLEGGALGGIASAFSGGRFAPSPLEAAELAALRRLEGHTLEHRGMPDAVRLELPGWLLSRLAERYGPALEAELQALLQPAPLDLRVNLLKTTREAAQVALTAEGLDAVPTRFSPWGLRIANRRPVTTGPAFQSGLVEIQDEGSQLVAALVGAHSGHRVCDFCAGAGGKTLALAMTMANRGQIVACDTSSARLDNATRRLRRAGVSNVERHLLEPGDKWAKRRAGSFDRVLVDAPCTGTGTWRRNPDARQRLTEADLAELTARQAAILDAAAPLVRKRGRMVYATCALLEEENEAQVMHFLARHPGFSLVPLDRAWPFDGAPPCGGDFLTLTPARHGTDGFFAAVLECVA